LAECPSYVRAISEESCHLPFTKYTARTYDIKELEDCAIAIDATYYLSQLLDSPSAHEPLLPALGGLTGIQAHISNSLDQWEKHNIVPFFIFDGQSIIGQEEVSLKRGQQANQKTNEAWNLYSQSQAEQAVRSFGANPGKSLLQRFSQVLH
jgi:hypothetical protein